MSTTVNIESVTVEIEMGPSTVQVDIQGAVLGTGGSSAVTSVFGRTGAIVATTGDYSASMVTGLGNAATRNVGTTSGTVAAGDDSRLNDARTPTTHGSDKHSASYDPAGAASSAVSSHNSDGISAHGGIVADDDSRLTDNRNPTNHDHSGNKLTQANTHESADTDSATTALHHTLGTGANNACAGNDGRLSDPRTPTSHDHSGNKLSQANTHETPDTDTATTSLHHTLGTGQLQASAGMNAGVNYEVLSGTKTIADGDPAIQILSCAETYTGGGNYTVNLPTTPVKSTRFYIRNDSVNTQVGRSLFITVNSVVISTLRTGGFGDFYWTSSGWRNFSPGGIDGVVTTTKQGIAIGEKAMTPNNGVGEVSIGYNSSSRVQSVSIGQNAASTSSGVAVGNGSSSSSNNAGGAAIGCAALSSGRWAVALGPWTVAARSGEFSLTSDYPDAASKNKYSNCRWTQTAVSAGSTNYELFLIKDGTQRFTMVANSICGFELHFVGRDTVTANRGYYAIVKGAIERNGSNVTSLIGTTTFEEVAKTAGVTWTVDAIADDANDALVPIILTTDPTNITAWTVTGFITTCSA